MSANPAAPVTDSAPNHGLLAGQALAAAIKAAPKAAQTEPQATPEPSPTPEPRRVAPPRASGPRRRPLARFTDLDEGPNFYLSLSDLMCLLMVFFVLIYSLTDAGTPLPSTLPAPTPPVKEVKAVAPVKAVMGLVPRRMPDPFPNIEPLPAQVGQAVTQVAGRGQGDPGLMAPGPISQELPAESPRAAVFDRALLTLVASGAPLPPRALPGDEPSLGSLFSQGAGAGMEVEQDAHRVLLRLPESITFDLAQAEVKPGMAATLAHLAQLLTRHPEVPVIITGHTDDLPIHNAIFASNWELSAARAAAVGRSLLAQGLDQSRMTIRGLADRQPRAPNADEASRAQNRRVEIELRLDQQG